MGVALAGGHSRRLGRDKARLRIGETSFADHALDRLRQVCSEALIADGGRDLSSKAPSVEDGPGRGPAAGILGAARARPGRQLLVLGCDLPSISAPLLAEIVLLGNDADWALPRTRRGIEPLVALYGPAALAALEGQVADGKFALRELTSAPDLKIRYLEKEGLRRFGSPEELLLNVNTPEDLARWRSRGPVRRR